MAAKKAVVPNDAFEPTAPLVGAATYHLSMSGIEAAIIEYFERRGVIPSEVSFPTLRCEDDSPYLCVVLAEQQPVELQIRRRRRQKANKE